MTVPFGKMKELSEIEKHYSEIRSMAQALLKALSDPTINARRVMRDFDEAMTSKDLSEAPSALRSVMKTSIPFDIYFSLKVGSLFKIIRGDFLTDPAIKDSLHYIGESNRVSEDALVIFKMKHINYFVCHNIELWKSPTPRIIIPASKSGIRELTIQSLANFAKDQTL